MAIASEQRTDKPHVARAVTTIHASISNVWNALVDPALIKQYMFGASVSSDWKEGSPIVWKGEWQGKPVPGQGSDSSHRTDARASVQSLQSTLRTAGNARELSHCDDRTL